MNFFKNVYRQKSVLILVSDEPTLGIAGKPTQHIYTFTDIQKIHAAYIKPTYVYHYFTWR
jgi:hypothetical protein